MRSKMIEITMRIPITAVDCNGVRYDVESIKQAVDTLIHIPIMRYGEPIEDESGVMRQTKEAVLGHITNAQIDGDKIVVDGILYHGGTCEEGEIKEKYPENVFSVKYFTAVGITT